jgi:argininosuccinate synthase
VAAWLTVYAAPAGNFHFVLHGMTGKGRVIRFEVKFKVLEKVVFTQEVQAGCRIGIVLMFGWFLFKV